MKKTLNIIASAVIALAAITSCAKEQLIENVLPAGEAIQVSINGQIGELTPADATKATAGSVVRVTWETGDEVYVYDGTACIGTLTVTPDEKNASYALLSGTIHSAASPAPSKLTLVYVKDATKAPDITEGKISIDLSNQNKTEVPFVLYTTVDYDAAKLAKENEYISFSFATSVMTVNCTGLQTGAEDTVTKAEIDGVSTICELTVTGSGVTVAGTTPGKITRTAGFQQSDQRASFSVALAKTAASVTGRTIKVTKGGRQFTASYPKNEFDVSKSFNSVFALEAVPYRAIPFTITSTGSTTVAIVKNGEPYDISLYYKKGSADWSAYSIDSKIELADGEFVQFRAGEDGNEGFSKEEYTDYYNISVISVDGKGTVSASGNIMSLLDSSLERTSLNAYMFHGLFDACMNLTDASNLVLPAETLAKGCYSNMFFLCTALTAAPALPAETLAESCYEMMFSGCMALTAAPALTATELAKGCYSNMFVMCMALTAAPALTATKLAEECYSGMFSYCTTLTAAPVLTATELAKGCYRGMFSYCTTLTATPTLPAEELAEECYYQMFSGCEGLTAATALPAEELAKRCYSQMFEDCTGLTAAPELPATELAEECYSYMFYGCGKLNYVKALFINFDEKNTAWWLKDVASSGTFVKNASADWNETSENGIPAGWKVVTYSPS